MHLRGRIILGKERKKRERQTSRCHEEKLTIIWKGRTCHICWGPALMHLDDVIALKWGREEAESVIVVTGEGCSSWSRYGISAVPKLSSYKHINKITCKNKCTNACKPQMWSHWYFTHTQSQLHTTHITNLKWLKKLEEQHTVVGNVSKVPHILKQLRGWCK